MTAPGPILRAALGRRLEHVRRRHELPAALPRALPRCGFVVLDVPDPAGLPWRGHGHPHRRTADPSILIDLRDGTPRLALLAWDPIAGTATPAPLAEGGAFWAALGDALLLPPETGAPHHHAAPAPQLRQAALF